MPATHVNATSAASGTAGSFTCAKPSGIVAGSTVLIAFHNSDTGVLGDMGTPTGGATWQAGTSYTCGTAGGTLGLFKAWWKVASAADVSATNYGFTQNSGADGAVTIVAISGADTGVAPKFSAGVDGSANSTTISTPGITPLGANDIEYRFAGGRAQTGPTWSFAASTPTFTPLPGVQSSNYTNHRIAYRQLTSAAATGSVTATTSLTQAGKLAITVVVKSAAAAATQVDLGWAGEDDSAYALTPDLGVSAMLGWASEVDIANPVVAEITLPLEFNLGIALEDDLVRPFTHSGGQPPPPPPPGPPRDTQDPRMPFVSAEIGFITDASIQGYLVLDDPERGRLDTGKLAPGGGSIIGGEIFEDVSRYLSAASVRQGATRADGPLIRYEAGAAQVVLRNEDRRFDPTNLDGPYVVGSGSTTTGDETFACTKGLLRAFGVTINVKSHASTGPASLRDHTAAVHLGASTSLAKPPGTVQNDYLIAINLSDWGIPGEMGNPTGGASWGSPLVSQSYGTNRGHLKVWGKYAGAAEPSNYGFTKNSSADSVLVVLAIRDVALGAVPVVNFELVENAALIDTPSTTPSAPNDFEVRVAGGVASGGTLASWQPPQGLIERVDQDSNGYATLSVATRALNAVGEGESQVLPMRSIRLMATWGSDDNMVANPSFEGGSTAGWSGSDTSLAASTTQSLYGNYSMTVTKTDDNPLHLVQAATSWTVGTAADGDPVTASFWVYVPASAYDALDAFLVRGLDETGNESVAFGFRPKPGQADRWERVVVSSTVAPGKVLYGLQIQLWTTGGHANGQLVAYLDGIQMAKGSKVKPFTNNVKRFPLWQGFIDQWDVAWDDGKGPFWSEVTVPATDAFKVFENVDRLPSTPAGAGEDTGARINRILDTVFWPTDARQIDIGDSSLQETTLEGTVLQELQHAVDSELGEFYMDSSGRAVFRRRNAVLTEPRSTDPQAVFGDDYLDPQELPWESLSISNDDTQLVNKVSVGRAGGVVQVVEDADSQTKFLIRTHNREDLLLETDAEALAYANWILEMSSKPELRFDSMTINPLKDPWRLFPQVLERQIGDRIQIIRRPPGGGDPIIRDVIIRGIQHEIGQVSWKTTWQFQSASKFDSVVPF